MSYHALQLMTHFQRPSFSQEAIECFEIIETKMVLVLCYTYSSTDNFLPPMRQTK